MITTPGSQEGATSTSTPDEDDQRPWRERLQEWREITMGWNVPTFLEHFTYHSGHLGEYKKGRLVEATDKDVWRWESGATLTIHAQTRRILAAMGAPLPPHRKRQRSSNLTEKSRATTLAVTPEDLDDEGWQHVPRDAAALVGQITRKDLALNRRELGQLFAKVLVGGTLLDRLERWLATPTPSLASTGHLPRSIGYQELSEIETAAQVFRNWDDQFGGGLRRKAVIGQLNEVSDLIGEHHPEDMTRRLHGVMAELAETAAMMSWDSGYQAVAQRYYLMALHAARTAGDHAFAANIMGGGMARQLLYLGEPGDALELVRLAQREGREATPSVRSMLHTREAWAYAALGRFTAFEQATGLAEEAYGDRTPDVDPHWIGYYDRAELDGTTGGRLLELAHNDVRHSGAAVDRISGAIERRRAGRLRSSALDEAGLAEALILRGDLDQAAAAGHRAVDTASQTQSDRVRLQLRSLYDLTSQQTGAPTIRALRERMAQMYRPDQTS